MAIYVMGRKLRLSSKRESIFCRRVIALLTVLSLTVFFTVTLYHRAAPIAVDNAVREAEALFEKIVQEAVSAVMEEKGFDYDSFSTPVYRSDGSLDSLSVNSGNLSSLRTLLLKKINTVLSDNSRIAVFVPIGTLIAPRYFGGRGFCIRLTAMTYTALKIKLTSEAASVGINQTIHRLCAVVTTDSTLYCIDEKSNFTYSYTVILAERLLFGSVPDAFFEYGS